MKHGVTESELNTVKARISKGMVRNLQTSEDWVNTHETEAFFQDGAFHTVEDFIDGVSSLTPEDIRSTANKYLKKETFYTAICGNYK